MIAHFALMGDLYQYDPYETEASLWNSYPWQIGLENNLDISASLPEANMSKMIWELGDNDSAVGSTSAVLGSFGMFATLILLDNFGNIGSDAGNNDPSPIPSSNFALIPKTASLVSVASMEMVIVKDSNSEAISDFEHIVSPKTASLVSVASMEMVIVKDSNSEAISDFEHIVSPKTASLVSVASTLKA